MVLRQIPKNIDSFIEIKDMYLSEKLQKSGFMPVYIYNCSHWYEKTDTILDLVVKYETD